MSIEQIAMAVTTNLTPFAPFLIEAGKEGSKKMVEVIAEKGGEAAWEQAQRIWQTIRNRFINDKEVKNVIELVAEKPENARYQDNLKQLLIERMQADAGFTDELLQILGGQEAVQRITATRGSLITNPHQQSDGPGEQTIEAHDDSIIENPKQTIKWSRGQRGK